MKPACVLCFVLLALSSTSGEARSITEIVDETGDGGANQLNFPEGIALDAMGNVYITGGGSDNAFKITPAGSITLIIDQNGDGAGNILAYPQGIAVDRVGNVYVAGFSSSNAFKITPGGVITDDH